MPEIVTLKLNSDFRRAYGRGKSFAGPILVTYAVRNRLGICRIGITTSKKLGNAVERNRCRRIIRAAFSSVSESCRGGWDIVFVARFKTKKMKSTEIEKIMLEHLRRAGIINKTI